MELPKGCTSNLVDPVPPEFLSPGAQDRWAKLEGVKADLRDLQREFTGIVACIKDELKEARRLQLYDPMGRSPVYSNDPASAFSIVKAYVTASEVMGPPPATAIPAPMPMSTPAPAPMGWFTHCVPTPASLNRPRVNRSMVKVSSEVASPLKPGAAAAPPSSVPNIQSSEPILGSLVTTKPTETEIDVSTRAPVAPREDGYHMAHGYAVCNACDRRYKHLRSWTRHTCKPAIATPCAPVAIAHSSSPPVGDSTLLKPTAHTKEFQPVGVIANDAIESSSRPSTPRKVSRCEMMQREYLWRQITPENYSLDTNIHSCSELWTKWKYGSLCKPSIEWMKTNFKLKEWAAREGHKTWVYTRALIIKEIEWHIADSGMPEEVVLAEADRMVQELGSMYRLAITIRTNSKNGLTTFFPYREGSSSAISMAH